MYASEKEIRNTFERHGLPLASFNSFFGAWSANSQYGYPLAWFKDRETAEIYTIIYYVLRPKLIRVTA